MAYISWFNKIRINMSRVGIAINGILHHARPIRQCPKCGTVFGDGPCPECKATAAWRQAECKKCGSIRNAFVFQSTTDKFYYFVFCQKCNKFEFVMDLPDPPPKYKKSERAEEPPPIGSLTKPV